MSPAGDIASWHEFYALLGTAAATLVGLLFVAATVASGVFSADRQAPIRMFLSATVVHFSSVLAASLIVLAPVPGWLLGAMVLACGLLGVGYYGLALHDATRDGLIRNVDLEDRTWYAALPIGAYVAEALAGALLIARSGDGIAVLAVSLGALLIIGLHNAWDITVWTISRRGQ
jgi:hypothetical protein